MTMTFSNNPLKTSAQYIKGVGPKKIKLLDRLAINTIEDLLYYFPRRHEDRSKFLPISELEEGRLHTARGKIIKINYFRTRIKKMHIFRITLADGTGLLHCAWFKQPYLRRFFNLGDIVVVYGKTSRHDSKHLQMLFPEYEVIAESQDEEGIHTGRIVPIYSLTEDVKQRNLRSIAKTAVDKFAKSVKDPLPGKTKARYRLIELPSAIKNCHFPQTETALRNSRRRIIFDEFFFFQAALALRRIRLKFKAPGIAHDLEEGLGGRLEKSLPFELTGAQRKAVDEISSDMKSARPMCRLLQGEVGSGKTVVACFGIVLASACGYQAAFMAPTEILVQQHYATLKKLLEPLGIKIGFISSSIKSAEKKKLQKQIKDGLINVVVGTHSLIQETIDFKLLSFVVIDEQHKFGVSQRQFLNKKGANPDMLVMTATPIPRTLALTVYGDLDISIIDELPPGRGKVETIWVGHAARKQVFEIIREQVSAGRQAFVIYPQIDESEHTTLRAATKMYESFTKSIFPDLNVALVHGRLTSEEKKTIMKDFRLGKIDVLVSTVVVEVGIDMPNATCMVVENADHFGLAQLHQLRGRIARSKHDSYCMLISDPKTEDAEFRLKAMVATGDGFEISKADLKLRGPGDFFGLKQHGIPEFRMGDLLADANILNEAKQEAFRLMKEDPELSRGEHALIKNRVMERYSTMGPF